MIKLIAIDNNLENREFDIDRDQIVMSFQSEALLKQEKIIIDGSYNIKLYKTDNNINIINIYQQSYDNNRTKINILFINEREIEQAYDLIINSETEEYYNCVLLSKLKNPIEELKQIDFSNTTDFFNVFYPYYYDGKYDDVYSDNYVYTEKIAGSESIKVKVPYRDFDIYMPDATQVVKSASTLLPSISFVNIIDKALSVANSDYTFKQKRPLLFNGHNMDFRFVPKNFYVYNHMFQVDETVGADLINNDNNYGGIGFPYFSRFSKDKDYTQSGIVKSLDGKLARIPYICIEIRSSVSNAQSEVFPIDSDSVYGIFKSTQAIQFGVTQITDPSVLGFTDFSNSKGTLQINKNVYKMFINLLTNYGSVNDPFKYWYNVDNKYHKIRFYFGDNADLYVSDNKNYYKDNLAYSGADECLIYLQLSNREDDLYKQEGFLCSSEIKNGGFTFNITDPRYIVTNKICYLYSSELFKDGYTFNGNNVDGIGPFYSKDNPLILQSCIGFSNAYEILMSYCKLMCGFVNIEGKDIYIQDVINRDIETTDQNIQITETSYNPGDNYNKNSFIHTIPFKTVITENINYFENINFKDTIENENDIVLSYINNPRSETPKELSSINIIIPEMIPLYKKDGTHPLGDEITLPYIPYPQYEYALPADALYLTSTDGDKFYIKPQDCLFNNFGWFNSQLQMMYANYKEIQFNYTGANNLKFKEIKQGGNIYIVTDVAKYNGILNNAKAVMLDTKSYDNNTNVSFLYKGSTSSIFTATGSFGVSINPFIERPTTEVSRMFDTLYDKYGAVVDDLLVFSGVLYYKDIDGSFNPVKDYAFIYNNSVYLNLSQFRYVPYYSDLNIIYDSKYELRVNNPNAKFDCEVFTVPVNNNKVTYLWGRNYSNITVDPPLNNIGLSLYKQGVLIKEFPNKIVFKDPVHILQC